MPLRRRIVVRCNIACLCLLGSTYLMALEVRAQEGATTSVSPAEDGSQIEIRNAPSFTAATAPLFVVDGVVMTADAWRRTSLANVAPEDIVSIEVLRREAATDLFGKDASRGVVVITTRHARRFEEHADEGLTLLGAYPNPTSDRATISFSITEASELAVTLFDALGRRVLMVPPQRFHTGRHDVEVEVAGLASGTYVFRVDAGGHVSTGRLAVVR